MWWQQKKRQFTCSFQCRRWLQTALVGEKKDPRRLEHGAGARTVHISLIKGPSLLNLPYIQYILALSVVTTTGFIIMFGNYVFWGSRESNPLSYHGGQICTSVETTWNPLSLGCVLPLQVRLNSYHAF